MKKNYYNAHKLAKRGLSPLQQAQINQMAHTRDKEIQEQVFKYMLIIPLMVLKENYWQKGSKQKFKQFFGEMLELYQDIGTDYTMEDAKKYMLDMLGIDYDKFIK